jgi:hypothetical protein
LANDLELLSRQGQQFNTAHLTNQVLGNARNQVKLCRASEYEVAHDLAIVNQALQPRQE